MRGLLRSHLSPLGWMRSSLLRSIQSVIPAARRAARQQGARAMRSLRSKHSIARQSAPQPADNNPWQLGLPSQPFGLHRPQAYVPGILSAKQSLPGCA